LKVIVTGFSGFLGGSIVKSLVGFGNSVVTIGRSAKAEIVWDFFHNEPELPFSEMVVHCAGLAHLNAKLGTEEGFMNVNFNSTVNLCNALYKQGKLPATFVFISTIAVYGIENGEGISEKTEPNPITPYGKSKLRAEKFLIDWAKENHVKLLILRLPLIVGENPPGNLGAMVKAIKGGYYFRLGKGLAKRSMVLANDVGDFISTSADKNGVINLTDGMHPAFFEIENFIASFYKKRIFSMPKFVLSLLGKIGDVIPFLPINTYRVNKLSQNLTFSDELARRNFAWNSRPVIGNFKPE
jgi:nucleoside-diphosphate-sugar epimerase